MADYDTEILADSPIFYGKLELASGLTETDLSTNARTITFAPSSSGSWTGGTLASTGPSTVGSDKAPDFNGTSGYAEIGSHIKLSTSTSGTMEAWVYMDSSPTTFRTVCGFGSDSSNNGLKMGVFDVFGSGSNRLRIYDSGASQYVYGSTVLVQAGGWYHIVVTGNGSAWNLYVNGNAETLTTVGANTGKWFGGITASGTNWTTIGANMRFGVTENFFPGRISRVAVYDSVLGSTRIAAHYAAINTAPSSGSTMAATRYYQAMIGQVCGV